MILSVELWLIYMNGLGGGRASKRSEAPSDTPTTWAWPKLFGGALRSSHGTVQEYCCNLDRVIISTNYNNMELQLLCSRSINIFWLNIVSLFCVFIYLFLHWLLF